MSEVLVLVPTPFEMQKLQLSLSQQTRLDSVSFEVCGFGPIASAIGATRLIAKHHPGQVILAGIAGAIGPSLSIGTAAEFSRVACYGVGAGSGSDFETFQELGWAPWHTVDGKLLADVVVLNDRTWPMVVSVCAASGCEEDVANHLRCFPDAVAEDMESYSVAMACRCANVPIRIFRGISNIAGDRDKTRWNIDAAIAALAQRMTTELPS